MTTATRPRFEALSQGPFMLLRVHGYDACVALRDALAESEVPDDLAAVCAEDLGNLTVYEVSIESEGEAAIWAGALKAMTFRFGKLASGAAAKIADGPDSGEPNFIPCPHCDGEGEIENPDAGRGWS